MAQSGFTPIQLYRSTTPTAVPLAGNLVAGELAINLADEKLYFENASGVVKVLADSAVTGTVTSVAASGGTTGLSFTGSPITTTGTLTLSGTLVVANGGTGASTFTANGVLLGNGTSAVSVTAVGTTGQVLVGNTGAAPTWATLSSSAVTSFSAGTTGLTPSTSTTGSITLAGTLAVTNGGTGGTDASTARSGLGATATGAALFTAVDAAAARTTLGATTVGANVFTLTNPSAITFPRFNADNTVSALDAATFRTAIGAGTGGGSVTSVAGTGTVNGITLTGTVTSSGSLTLGGTLSGVDLATQTSGTLAVARGGTGATDAGTARSNLSAAASGAVGSSGLTMNTARMLGRTTASAGAVEEITIGSGLSLSGGTLVATSSGGTVTSVAASGGTTGLTFSGSPITTSGTLTLSGTLAVANGGTGATTVSAARTALGSTTVGDNLFTLTNPSAIRFLRVNTDNTVSALDATNFRTAIGAGTGSGTVTSVNADGGTTGLSFSGGPVTGSGTLTLAGTLAVTNGGTGGTSQSTARSGLGATIVGANFFTLTNPSSETFVRINADNTINTLDAPTFRTAIGAGTSSTTGTVTSVGGTGTASGLTLSGTVTSSGNLTLSGTVNSLAAGTYGISISGNAATATTANALNTGNSYTAVGYVSTATSGVALAVGDNSAIRNSGSASTIYVDVAAGGASAGSLVLRNTNSFTAMATFSGTGTQLTSLGVGTAPSGTAGEIRATDNVTAYYSSDARLKENVQPIADALGIVSAVGGKTFDWTDTYIADHGGEDGYFVRKSDFGVIAQDVEAVFPLAVRTREDGTLAVDYEKLVAVAFAAIAELRAEVNELRQQTVKVIR